MMKKNLLNKMISGIILCLVFSLTLQAQNNKITGNVVDEGGLGLPGVTVVIKGTTTGTVTDLDGNFALSNVSSEATIVLSFIGMKSQEISVGNQTDFNVTMESESFGIEEIVAIGYGTMKKSDLTGAVSSVSAADLTSRPTPTVAAALQGKASGVLVKTRSSAPGSSAIIQIRGANSINGSFTPLYVVDGLPLSDIDAIDPSDIQSLEVLKDASSTAIYGSRGANGVILITTKKGKTGKAVVSYNARATFETFVKKIDLMNGSEYAQAYTDWEIGKNRSKFWFDGSEFYRPTPESAGEGTDWFDTMTQSGMSHSHQLGISGGSEKSKYSMALNYFSHDGVVIGNKFDRFGFRISNSYQITDRVTTGFDVYINRSLKNTTGNAGAVYRMTPTDPMYKPDGDYHINTNPNTGNSSNPYAAAMERTDLNRHQRVFGNFYVDFEPIKDLHIKISAGGDSDEGKLTEYSPSTTHEGGLVDGIANIRSTSRNYWINENIVTYKKEIGVHRFDALAGFTYEQNVNESFQSGATGFASDALLFNNLGGGNAPGAPASNKTKSSLASVLGRINYAYNDRYLFAVTARRDGSSKFGSGNKFGFFPSVAGAWRLSEEDFIKDISAISYMKLRVGYGQVGNSNIGLYKSLAVFGTDNYVLNGQIVPGVSIGGNRAWNTDPATFLNKLDNTDLKWETTANTNIGLDISFLDRFSFAVDAYYKKTTDLLLNASILETSGSIDAFMNVGSLENKGLEFSADLRLIDTDIKWNLGGFVSFNKNQILELNGDISSAWKIGQPFGVARTWVIEGIIETAEDLAAYTSPEGVAMRKGATYGDYYYKDVNGDYIIDAKDYVPTFDPNPDFIYSINSDVSYKQFALSASLYGSEGHQIYNKVGLHSTTTIRSNLAKDMVDNYWTAERPTGSDYPRLSSKTTDNNNDANIEDGSFLRLQNVMLSYNVPMKKVFNKCRIYVSGQNLFTITGYTGYDPDVSANDMPITTQSDNPGQNSNQRYGFDYGAYPTPTSVTVGLEITFK
jgi:TonB-linked SusC/RagA family outer membrane protein